MRTPSKKRNKSKIVLGKVHDSVKSAIHSKVYRYFFDNKQPTLDKLLSDVNSDADLCNPEFKRSSFHALLLDIGFAFVHRKTVNVLLYRDNIHLWICKYLRNIRWYRNEIKKIYYLNETGLTKVIAVLKYGLILL